MDEINTTYDEVRVYNSSYQKGRASISAMSEITGTKPLWLETAKVFIVHDQQFRFKIALQVDWTAIMKNVPRIEEAKSFVDGERSQSPISNITDITVNENRVKFLNDNDVVIKKSLFATTEDCV